MLLWSLREVVYLLSLKNKGNKRRSADLNQGSFLSAGVLGLFINLCLLLYV